MGMVMRSIIPVVMAGVLGIYGLITAVIINGHIDPAAKYSAYSGYAHLGAGLTVGLSPPFRWHDPDSHLRRSLGLVRSHRGTCCGLDRRRERLRPLLGIQPGMSLVAF